MIYDFTGEEKGSKSQKKYQSVVEEAMNSRKYRILSKKELKKFIDQHQIIHCAHYLEEQLSYEKLIKIYFLLFQVSSNYSERQSIYNFLCQHDFSKKLFQSKGENFSNANYIISTKISKFLDSFKIRKCQKTQINSLISEYHEYRLLENTKQPYILEACSLIKQYIYYHLNLLIGEIEETSWSSMSQRQFIEFYRHFSEICTICKRASYIRCNFFNFPAFEITSSVRNKIQDRNLQIMSERSTQDSKKLNQITNQRSNSTSQINQVFKQNKESALIPVISVKKKLKAMNSLILKMQQNI